MKKLFFFVSMTIMFFAAAQRPLITKWNATDGIVKLRIVGASSYTYKKATDPATIGGGMLVSGLNIVTLPTAGVYNLSIIPNNNSFRFVFNNAGLTSTDVGKFIELSQWGDVTWNSDLSEMFLGCENLQITAEDIPDFSTVTDMTSMFELCNRITTIPNVNSWDVSNVVSMRGMFHNCSNFNDDISSWNVGNVKDMARMFSSERYGHKFSQDISSWNVSKVTDMSYMFAHSYFNQNINKWDISSVKNFEAMFVEAHNFNQSLSSWSLKNAIVAPTFQGTKLSCENYTSTLWGWSQNAETPANLNFRASGVHYGFEGKPYRDILITKGWKIEGDIFDSNCTATLNLNETKNKIELQMFPNPTADYFKMNSLQADVLSLYDMSGKLMKTQKLTVGQNTVDISNFPKGVYIAKTANASAKIIKK